MLVQTFGLFVALAACGSKAVTPTDTATIDTAPSTTATSSTGDSTVSTTTPTSTPGPDIPTTTTETTATAWWTGATTIQSVDITCDGSEGHYIVQTEGPSRSGWLYLLDVRDDGTGWDEKHSTMFHRSPSDGSTTEVETTLLHETLYTGGVWGTSAKPCAEPAHDSNRLVVVEINDHDDAFADCVVVGELAEDALAGEVPLTYTGLPDDLLPSCRAWPM